MCSEEENPHSRMITQASAFADLSSSSLIRILPVSALWLKSPFTQRLLSVCSEEGSPHSRTITQASASGRSLRLFFDWATVPWKAPPQPGPYGLLPVGNYCPKGSSPSSNCFGSSPIRQLSSERFISNWVTACLFVFPGGKPPLENHSTNTYLWVPKAHL